MTDGNRTVLDGGHSQLPVTQFELRSNHMSRESLDESALAPELASMRMMTLEYGMRNVLMAR